MKNVVVIGAGIGGLTTAAYLAKAGMKVTVLEAHVYPGGAAGTFYYQGYRFDAGATLAGGYGPGGPMDRLAQDLNIRWPGRNIDPAMRVVMPDGQNIDRYGDEYRWEERREKFGAASLPFWRWQERTADSLWDLAQRNPPWPPQDIRQTSRLLKDGLSWIAGKPLERLHPGSLSTPFKSVADKLNGASEALKLFVDAQLLISAQATSQMANAWYGASALDLPRRGVIYLEGGLGTLADQLVKAIEAYGGQVLLRQEVSRIIRNGNKPVAVETKRKDSFPADLVIANQTPWNIAQLMGNPLPGALQNLSDYPEDGWGAFMIYLGIDGATLPKDLPHHNQVLRSKELGDGNSIFVSISPGWDLNRAPIGHRAITISTHTDLKSWWELYRHDLDAYQARKDKYTEDILDLAARAIPDVRDRTALQLQGTPVTYQRFTRRAHGWVGGFPQTSLFRMWGPRISPGIWMVGDSIFPGQSTTAVALGGRRVADLILQENNIPFPVSPRNEKTDNLVEPPQRIRFEQAGD